MDELPYEPKYKWGTSGERTTISTRLVPADLALLDGLVAAGYGGPLEPESGSGYFRVDRAAAVRRAIREAAVSAGVSSRPPGKRPSRSGWKGKCLIAIERGCVTAKAVAEFYELRDTASILTHLEELEREGWIRKLGRLYTPLHPKEGRS